MITVNVPKYECDKAPIIGTTQPGTCLWVRLKLRIFTLVKI